MLQQQPYSSHWQRNLTRRPAAQQQNIHVDNQQNEPDLGDNVDHSSHPSDDSSIISLFDENAVGFPDAKMVRERIQPMHPKEPCRAGINDVFVQSDVAESYSNRYAAPVTPVSYGAPTSITPSRLVSSIATSNPNPSDILRDVCNLAVSVQYSVVLKSKYSRSNTYTVPPASVPVAPTAIRSLYVLDIATLVPKRS